MQKITTFAIFDKNKSKMKITDDYNPEVHCCEYWYKDFCACTRDEDRMRKWRNLDSTIKMLDKNGIKYNDTKVENIVSIPIRGGEVNLSLKKSSGLFKVRFKGSAKWYEYSKERLLNLIAPKNA